MNKNEFMAMSLPYGLKVLRPDNSTILEIQGVYLNNIIFTDRRIGNTKKSKPILRPLSDLTKEIKHDGEKFVPIVKLASYPEMKLDILFIQIQMT